MNPEKPLLGGNGQRLTIINPSYFHSHGWAMNLITNNPILQMLGRAAQGLADVYYLDLSRVLGIPSNAGELARFKSALPPLMRRVLKKGQFVAISCWTSLQYLSAVHVAEVVKRCVPDTRIIVGGYHPSAIPGDFTEFPSLFDHVVVGRGDVALQKILTGGAPCGPVRENSEHPVADLLPEQFPEKLFLVNHVPVGVYLSAGCPYRCSFCAEATMSNRQWNAIEPEQGAALIKRIEQQYRPNLILILDACFGVSRSWRRAFLEALAKAQLQTKVWTNNRVDQYDEEDIRLFSKVPVLLEFGLESGSSEMLAVMGKTKRPRDYLRRAKNVLTLASKYQLQHNINLIFNHPGETPETFHETIDFLKGVRKDQQGSQALMEAQSFKLFPGCDIWSRLDFYRKTYGTSIACKYWWRKLGDQRKLASEVKASKAIWEATQSYDYWHEPFEAIGGICYP